MHSRAIFGAAKQISSAGFGMHFGIGSSRNSNFEGSSRSVPTLRTSSAAMLGSSSSLMEASTASLKIVSGMKSGQSFWNRGATKCCGFGITISLKTWRACSIAYFWRSAKADRYPSPAAVQVDAASAASLSLKGRGEHRALRWRTTHSEALFSPLPLRERDAGRGLDTVSVRVAACAPISRDRSGRGSSP